MRLIDAYKLNGAFYAAVKEKTDKLKDKNEEVTFTHNEISSIILSQTVQNERVKFLENLKNGSINSVEQDGIIAFNKDWLLNNLEKEFNRFVKEKEGENNENDNN